jgi:hypothetical protein
MRPYFYPWEEEIWGDTPKPRQHPAVPVLSFPRKRESMCRVDRAERNPPPSHRVGDAHHRCLHTSASTPLFPHTWGIAKTQRGFAPLHASLSGTGEAKLARGTGTTSDSRREASRTSFETGSPVAPAIVRQFLTDRPQQPSLFFLSDSGGSGDSASAAPLEHPTTRQTRLT